ncbi:MAG TPA: hypothetical protein VNO30_02105 [Kofleriaceae bacterium]|nr:hypothetical protein [Kofleriaceae bacterium]
MVRRVGITWVLLSLLAGCGGSRAHGPAWPKLSEPETDGGESLAPRNASSVAAIEDADDATPGAATPAPAAGTAAPAASTAPAGRTERPADAPSSREPDVLNIDDIVIEIED